MNTVILWFHIISATILVLATVVVLVAAQKHRPTKAYQAMMGSFTVTIASGTMMLFVGFGGIGRICAAMSAVTLATIAARYYYLIRTQLSIQ